MTNTVMIGEGEVDGELPLWTGGSPVATPEEEPWSRIKALMKERIGPLMFERWFQRVGMQLLDDQRLVLLVPNLMHQYWIEDNYQQLLQVAASEVLPGGREIDYMVAADAVSEPPVLKAVVAPSPAAVKEAQAAGAPNLVPASFDAGVALTAKEAAKKMDRVTDKPEVATGPLFESDSRFNRLLMESGLNTRFSFNAFVVGPNCTYSCAVAKAVAEKPGRTYNPLFLHGAVGLGKTHLMQAIGREILHNKPKKVVRYVTSEAFTNEYIEALRHSKVSAFRQKYRKVDVLLIDDIQFFAGKGSTQEEFFHTFNDLFNSFKQIVLTSDRAPSEIKNLEARLVSRFEWGMATQIESPDLETRTAILRQKMVDWCVQVDDWVLSFLAENIRTNVRRLEGALMRVAAHISLGNGGPLTQTIVETLLRDILEEPDAKAVTIDWIQKVVAEHFDIRLADMTSHRRPASIAIPRQIAMHLARELTKSSLKEIGDAFGGRDHGTVIHACKAVSTKANSEEFRRTLGVLTEKIKKIS
ncbi:chromosomal replication initiator protein DnaA [Verrucomicrobium spinosum]|uniref:chromosomal replication initiator protein DnaA n=1 Tax=Verrucomicrobium spinosum TaxID=2736 RepID=UPI0001746B66|nr:chromosomal replication initiator protein DnaA [Verrucomicrobium spinosum]